MDLSAIVLALHNNLNPFTVILFVLLVASEVLGTVGSIKASSIYGVIRALLITAKDQVLPQPPAATVAPTPEQKA